MLRKDIKRIVAHYKRKFGTSDPFKLAAALHIESAIGNLGSRSGCYMYLKKHKCIFLNENLNEHEQLLVMAHELGHAILHPKENCYFIRNKTLLLNSQTETEANKFAVELLISDEELAEYHEFSISQLSRLFGYHEKLIELKLKG